MHCYTEALEVNPKDVEAMYGISEIHFGLQNLDLAEVQLRQLLEVDPKHTQALIFMGDIYRYRDAFKLAPGETAKMSGEVVYYYKEALDSDPTNVFACSSLGNYYTLLQEYDLAMFTFDACLKESPTSEVLILGMAELYKHKREFETCLSWAQKAMLVDYTQAHPYAVMGECALFADQSVKAMNALLKACQFDKGNEMYPLLFLEAVRSNQSLPPDEILRIMHSLDLQGYSSHVTREFKHLLDEVSQRLNRDEL